MNAAEKLRVVVVDDSEVVRAKLRELFAGDDSDGLLLIDEAPDGESGVQAIRNQQPDVVVMDLKMPGISGIEATWQLGTVSPETRVLMLTVSDDPTDVADAVMAGAKGYVVKGAPDDEILDAVRRVGAGETVISPQIAAELVQRSSSAMSVDSSRPGSPARAVRGVPARNALATVFTPRHLLQTLGIGIVVGALLTGINQGEEIVNGEATSETWAQAALNVFVVFVAVNVGLLAGRASQLGR